MTERKAFFHIAPFISPRHLKPQFAHGQMIALADTFEGWAQVWTLSPEHSDVLLAMSDAFRDLAEEVGPAWDPKGEGGASGPTQ